jgi:hypothetical protein
MFLTVASSRDVNGMFNQRLLSGHPLIPRVDSSKDEKAICVPPAIAPIFLRSALNFSLTNSIRREVRNDQKQDSPLVYPH